MKAVLYMNGKKTTRRAIRKLVGEERLKNMLARAKDGIQHDPNEEQHFLLSGNGTLAVEFA